MNEILGLGFEVWGLDFDKIFHEDCADVVAFFGMVLSVKLT